MNVCIDVVQVTLETTLTYMPVLNAHERNWSLVYTWNSVIQQKKEKTI